MSKLEYKASFDKQDKKLLKLFLIPFLVCLILSIFLPTKKELYNIFGVGGIIEYVKHNPSCNKQIPEDVINYLEDISK